MQPISEMLARILNEPNSVQARIQCQTQQPQRSVFNDRKKTIENITHQLKYYGLVNPVKDELLLELEAIEAGTAGGKAKKAES